jgi:hypothetical protein
MSCGQCGQPFHGVTACKVLDDLNYCPRSAKHQHHPTLSMTVKHNPSDGAYMDAVCVHCGMKGIALCTIAEVEWK